MSRLGAVIFVCLNQKFKPRFHPALKFWLVNPAGLKHCSHHRTGMHTCPSALKSFLFWNLSIWEICLLRSNQTYFLSCHGSFKKPHKTALKYIPHQLAADVGEEEMNVRAFIASVDSLKKQAVKRDGGKVRHLWTCRLRAV